MAKNFRDLSEREILALAVSLEEEDSRIYGDFADGLRQAYPDTARILDEIQHVSDAGVRKLLGDLAEVERRH
jgi:erythrin-vacuolar iron transport family protein